MLKICMVVPELYTLPEDSDLLAVKAVYTYNDKEHEVFSLHLTILKMKFFKRYNRIVWFY